MEQTKCKTHLLKEQQKNIFQMGFLIGDQSPHLRLGKFPFLAAISFICMQVIQHFWFFFFSTKAIVLKEQQEDALKAEKKMEKNY